MDHHEPAPCHYCRHHHAPGVPCDVKIPDGSVYGDLCLCDWGWAEAKKEPLPAESA